MAYHPGDAAVHKPCTPPLAPRPNPDPNPNPNPTPNPNLKNPNPDPHPNPNQVHKALRAATCSETGLSLPALARETGVSIARFERLVEAVAAADGDRRG